MSRRKSINIDGFKHANPIPVASKVGNLVVSGVINGVDPSTGKVAATLAEQCAFVLEHARHIVEAAGGTTEDIIKMTFWLRDRAQRECLNKEWVKMFPDPSSRPARHTLQSDLYGEILVQADVMAVIGE